MAVVEENRKSFPRLTYRKEAETWKDSNNQNKYSNCRTGKEVCSYAETKEVNVLEAENGVKIAERNGLFFFSFNVVWHGDLFLQTKENNKIILAQKRSWMS
jgi:hypothetical protein